MPVRFLPLPTADARRYQAGEADAYGLPPETLVSDGGGNPCRHCLTEIPAGEPMLVLAYSPFPGRQPYAETGPIFLCARPCAGHPVEHDLPAMFRGWQQALVRGYTAAHRIRYGSGRVTDMQQVVRAAEEIFRDPEVRYIHLRSASYNCYQCRIERA